MKPAITTHVEWSRFGMWIILSLLWLPLIMAEYATSDLGPDAARFHGLAITIGTVSMAGACFSYCVLAGSGHFWIGLLVPIVAYVILGVIARMIICSIGFGKRMLPEV